MSDWAPLIFCPVLNSISTSLAFPVDKKNLPSGDERSQRARARARLGNYEQREAVIHAVTSIPVIPNDCQQLDQAARLNPALRTGSVVTPDFAATGSSMPQRNTPRIATATIAE